MAKTVATLTEENSIIANIDGDRLKSAFRHGRAPWRRRNVPPGNSRRTPKPSRYCRSSPTSSRPLEGNLHQHQDAEGVFFDEHGDVTDGFKLKNTGSTTTVKDVAGLLAEAALLGYNEGAIRTRMTVSAKDAMEAMGIDKTRFEAEFADFIEIKKKADSLVRAILGMEYDCTACPVEGCARPPYGTQGSGRPRRWWRECRLALRAQKARDGRNPVPATDRSVSIKT